MNPAALSTSLFALLLAVAPSTAHAETVPWNVPEALRPTTESQSFKATFNVGVWLNPFYLRGDFDGDGKMDYAVLIVRREDGKKGIAIRLSSRSDTIIVGAGTKSRAGAAESDDWDFFDAWQVYEMRTVAQGAGEGKPPKLRGEAMLIEKSESASGLLYWDGKEFRWYQQGD